VRVSRRGKYHIAHQGLLKSRGQIGRNTEMDLLTQGIHDARELALGRMQAEAEACKARGVVGVELKISNHVWVSTRRSSSRSAPRSDHTVRL
jgi:uncharacterized protein YbjQ (UPF0145 family)